MHIKDKQLIKGVIMSRSEYTANLELAKTKQVSSHLGMGFTPVYNRSTQQKKGK